MPFTEEEVPELPEWLDPDAWLAFIAYRLTEAPRKRLRKRFGPVAQARMLAKLERLHLDGYDVTECIDHSIQSGWLGVFGKEDYKRKSSRHRETMVTNIAEVRQDKEKAAAGLAAARKAL